MKNHVSRTHAIDGTGRMFRLAACSFLLLTGCGPHATVDRWQAQLSGDIDKQEQISSRDLREILVRHFGNTRVDFVDDQYILPDNGKVSAIQVNKFAYCNGQAGDVFHPMDWNGNDYAAAALLPMKNYAFGIMRVTTTKGTKRTLNVFVNHKHEVHYWDPVSCQYYYDQFYKPDLIAFR